MPRRNNEMDARNAASFRILIFSCTIMHVYVCVVVSLSLCYSKRSDSACHAVLYPKSRAERLIP